jgi:DNA-binding response OmpR family regulator
VRIALLEDDEQLGKVMQLWIEAAGHHCYQFLSGEEFMRALKRDTYDVLILDWVLPDTTGDKVLDWVREHLGWKIPIIFVTHKDAQEDIVAALERGADDYMVKPVQPMEMLARITAVGRRLAGEPKTEKVLDKAPYRFDLASHTATLNGDPITLTQKEFDLALFLFQNSGRVLSRAHILDAVWGRSPDINTRTVDIHVSRIRKKLNLGTETGWQLAGVYNHGYRLERAFSEDTGSIPEDDIDPVED